jgi:hypothetical protein
VALRISSTAASRSEIGIERAFLVFRANLFGRDEQRPILEVHIFPLEREQLASAAHTFERRDDERL